MDYFLFFLLSGYLKSDVIRLQFIIKIRYESDNIKYYIFSNNKIKNAKWWFLYLNYETAI